MSPRPLKFLLARDSSGHTAGYHVIAMGLRDAGIDVTVMGHAEPEEVAEAALQEGADVVGYRVMDRDAEVLGVRLTEEMAKRGLAELPIVMGGIVRRESRAELMRCGVRRIFGPGSRLSDIAEFVLAQVDPSDARGEA